MRLSGTQKNILKAMARGDLLRSHRDIEGNKTFLIHSRASEPIQVSPRDVHRLRVTGLIDSNKKFPVATFWLTEAGSEFLALDSPTP